MKRVEGRTTDILVHVWFFFYCGFSEAWWGLVLYAEMNDLVVKCVLCPWPSVCRFGLYQEVFKALRDHNMRLNPDKCVEDEALVNPNPRRMLKAGLLLVGLLFCVFRIC